MKSKKSPLVKTTEDFAARTTVHGISYVFDASLSTIDRILWLGVTTILFNLTSDTFETLPGGHNILGAGWISDQPELE